MKTWGARFEHEPDRRAADFGRSVEVDSELAFDDLTGSLAHVRALGRAGILDAAEVDALVAGLEALLADARTGSIVWRRELEDVHMNLESALEERIGPLAQKLHTGRSRNDQVSTDLRLWLRRTIAELDDGLVELERALVSLALRHRDAVMPGQTHVQPAQPVLFAHHLLAYVEMLERDRGRLADAGKRSNLSPLGSGALAGAGFALDRSGVASELGFDGVTRNSIDASGDRDFVVEALAALALAMVHLSRLGEEIVWWSNPRFGFVRVADEFSTGSSMLPNKRNPDPAELIRGRAGPVIGNLTAALTMLKGLPLGYQRDLQEDKPLLFHSARTVAGSLAVMSGLVGTLEIDEARMHAAAAQSFTTAVAVADALVDTGVAFRSAHRIVGGLVRQAEEAGTTLDALTDDQIASALDDSGDERAHALALDPGIGGRLRSAATIDGALARSDVVGGTAPHRVRVELEVAATRLGLAAP